MAAAAPVRDAHSLISTIELYFEGETPRTKVLRLNNSNATECTIEAALITFPYLQEIIAIGCARFREIVEQSAIFAALPRQRPLTRDVSATFMNDVVAKILAVIKPTPCNIRIALTPHHWIQLRSRVYNDKTSGYQVMCGYREEEGFESREAHAWIPHEIIELEENFVKFNFGNS